MRWPWSRAQRVRGTITLLPDDRLIIGLPYAMSDAEVQDLVQTIREFKEKPGYLVLPWPFDVVNLQ